MVEKAAWESYYIRTNGTDVMELMRYLAFDCFETITYCSWNTFIFDCCEFTQTVA